MKFKVTKNEFPALRSRLTQIQKQVVPTGQKWAEESAQDFEETYQSHLATQGRGGAPPPLSEATEYLYSQYGEPDGSGILNHIEFGSKANAKGAIAWVGIPSGKPTVVAIVQDRGATITLTPKMRGFLASRGIFLRTDTMAIVVPGRGSWSDSIHRAIDEAKIRLKRDFNNIVFGKNKKIKP
jgi:hypothetical protein